MSIPVGDIYYRLDDLKAPCVLFMDYNGWWAPLSSLYFSSSSQALVSRHPESCIQEIIIYYCPQCLTRYKDEEVKTYQYRCPSCFHCPCCFSVAVVVALTSTDCVLQCGTCLWRSDACGLYGSDKSEIEIGITEREQNDNSKEAFKTLLQSMQSTESFRGKSTRASITMTTSGTVSKSSSVSDMQRELSKINSERWTIQDVDSKYKNTVEPYNPFQESVLYNFMRNNNMSSSDTIYNESAMQIESSQDLIPSNVFSTLSQRIQQESHQPLLLNHMLPVRFRLRSKRTLRCRKDVDEGKLSILVQPKTFPLEGDSSLKQRGKWWVKDASAIHELPRITIVKLPTLAELTSINSNIDSGSGSDDKGISSTAHIQLEITNPKDFHITITMLGFDPISIGKAETEVSALEDEIDVDAALCSDDAELLTLSRQVLRKPPLALSSALSQSQGQSLTIFGPTLVQKVELDAYEDELLRDEVVHTNAQLRPGEWDVRVQHNVARVSIPVAWSPRSGSGSDLPSELSPVVLELMLLMHVVDTKLESGSAGGGGGGAVKDFRLRNIPFRVMFPLK